MAGRLAEAQYTLGDGPCHTALTRRAPVLAGDLTRGLDADRWPVFAQQAVTHWIPDLLMTAVIAELDTRNGQFTWINCGHPPPLLIRDGHVLAGALERTLQPPLGFGFHMPAPPAQEQLRLQPGDRVLMYSDGIAEARSPDGDLYGEKRLADSIIRSTASGDSAPEALRRLVHNLLAYQNQHRLNDDATILLTEWHLKG
ncbi:PP2C family protein-serine/threonine phosphatase [Streptomyces xanthophaeus]